VTFDFQRLENNFKWVKLGLALLNNLRYQDGAIDTIDLTMRHYYDSYLQKGCNCARPGRLEGQPRISIEVLQLVECWERRAALYLPEARRRDCAGAFVTDLLRR
jgi:hypothetical protein